MNKSRVRLRKKLGKKELVESIVTMARLPQNRKTNSLFSRGQLVELELYVRRAGALLDKLTGEGNNADKSC